jgi:hypothetical protein
MRHFITYASLGPKTKGQKKSTLRYGTSPSLSKGEWEEKKDGEATDTMACCHFDLGSGDVTRLDSTSRSNIEDMSICKDDAITGRYLLRFVPPYNRDANFSLSDCSGQHQGHLSTQSTQAMTLHLRKLGCLLLSLLTLPSSYRNARADLPK